MVFVIGLDGFPGQPVAKVAIQALGHPRGPDIGVQEGEGKRRRDPCLGLDLGAQEPAKLLLDLLEGLDPGAGQPERCRGDVDRGQDAGKVGLARNRIGCGEGPIEPFHDHEIHMMVFGLRGIAGGRNPPDLGERRLEAGGVVVAPGERASKPEIVGQALGASSLAKDLGERPRFHGLPGVTIGLQAGDLAEALDGLAIVTRPGQAEPTIEPGVGVFRLELDQPAESGRCVVELRRLALAQLRDPSDGAGARWPACESDRPCGPPPASRARPRGSPAPVAPRPRSGSSRKARCQVPQAASGRCDMRWFQPSWTRASDASLFRCGSHEPSSPDSSEARRRLPAPGDQPVMMIRGFCDPPAGPTSDPGVQIDEPLVSDPGVQISPLVAETPR